MKIKWYSKSAIAEHSFLSITCGIDCGDRTNCPHYRECKYKSNYKFHNFLVDIHRFFEYRLHIKLPRLPICINREWLRLSGTDKCPYKMPRNYTCYDCEYVGGELFGDCTCKERTNTPYEEQKKCEPDVWHKYGQCGYFKKCAWADDRRENLEDCL